MLLVVSCSSDIYEQQIEKSNKSMKMLNRSEIVKIPKLTSKLTEIKSTQNKVQERIVADTTYNFSIDTNSAIYINSGASETYTFNIIRENSDEKIENLLLIANPDGTFKTFLIKYDFTNSEKQTQGFNPLNYKSPKYTEIEADYSQLVNNRCIYRSDFICVDTYEYDRIETNSGSNAGGALFYYGWRVVATNCTFVTQSSGCGGGESNLMLTFETSPIHTIGGYGGVTVSLTSNQQTFINALNILSSENFGIMNGDVQMSILNHVNTLTNSQINTVAYFFNNANTLWISNQSDQTQQSIFNYLISNGFSTQSRDKINGLINLAAEKNIDFEYINIDSNNPNTLTVSSISDFNSFIQSMQIETEDNSISSSSIIGLNNNFSTKTVSISTFDDLAIEVVSTPLPSFSLVSSDCVSFLSNFMIGHTWVQNSMNITNINYSVTHAQITLAGYINSGVTWENFEIGIKYRKKVKFLINKSNGQICCSAVTNLD